MMSTLLHAALLLAAVGVQVQGQFGGTAPSCLDEGVGDKDSCDAYCGGPSSNHMPTSIWVTDSGHCVCQNCMLRDCQGHSAGCAMPDGTSVPLGCIWLTSPMRSVATHSQPSQVSTWMLKSYAALLRRAWFSAHTRVDRGWWGAGGGASGEDSVEARSVQTPQAGSASLGPTGVFFAGGVLASMAVAARMLQRNRRSAPEERPLVGVDACTINTQV
jgi:hypothetical protein